MQTKDLLFSPLKNEILDKKNYLTQSLILHFIVLFFLYYGMPSLFKYRTEFLPPLPIEIINISNKTAAPKVNFDTNEKKKDKPDYRAEAKTTYKSENVAIRDDSDAIALKQKPKEIKKKIIKIDKIKEKPNQLQSVLRSIEEIEKNILNKKDKKKKENFNEKKEVTPKKLGIMLTISELDAIRRHFEKCWNIPSGAREAGHLATEIKVRFNKEGNVIDARIVNISRMKRDRYFRTASESALRAVLNPRCRQAPLPIDKYEKWKNITLNFDPKNVIGY